METSPVQRALAVCSHLDQQLTTAQVHDLLQVVEGLLGCRPRQVVGSPLRVRWILYADQSRNAGEIVELKLTPAVDNKALSWSVEARHHQSIDLLLDEHLSFKYQGDPLMRGETPYYYNICVDARERWENDFITEVADSYELEYSVGDVISTLSANLSAMPADWFDSPLRISMSAAGFWAEGDRNGLRVCLDSFSDGDLYSHFLLFTPEQALQCGRLVMESVLVMFAPGWPLGDLGLSCESVDRSRHPVSGFMTNPGCKTQLEDRERTPRLTDLSELALWTKTTEQCTDRERNAMPFPHPSELQGNED